MKQKPIILAAQENTEGKNLSDREIKKIIATYTKTVFIPQKKLQKQIMVCPVGLVGAGKTTVLKPISKKLGLVRISTDEIRYLLKKSGFNCLRTAEIAKKVAEDFLRQGFSLALDADCLAPDNQKYLKTAGRIFKAKLYWLHVKAPEKFILNKLLSYCKKPKFFKNNLEAVASYYRRKPLHKKYLSSVKFDYKIDTSKPNLTEQITDFIKIIKSK